MDYENERWMKVYTRDTGGWLSLSWQARGIALEISRKLDAEGKLPLGKRGLPSLAGVLRGRWEDLEPFVSELLADDRLVVLEGNVLLDPEHVARQEARVSARVRKKTQRDRDALSRDVTRGHAASRAVTKCHDQSRSDQIRSEEIRSEETRGIGTASPPPEPKLGAVSRRKPETACPDADDPPNVVNVWVQRWKIAPDHPEYLNFLEYHRKHDKRWRDWGAAWRQWLSKAPGYAPRGSAVPRQGIGAAAQSEWMNPTKNFDFGAGK